MCKYIILLVMALMVATAVSADVNDVSGISISLINQDPDPAIGGDIVEIRLGIENTGERTINNLMVELVPEYPFELVPGEEAIQLVGTIGPLQGDKDIYILKYRLKSDREVTAGEYELKVKYYQEGSSSGGVKSLNLDLENRESAEVIYIDKVELIPGKITPLKFTINNVGSAPLRDLSFKWENADDIILPVGSDNTKYINYIDLKDGADLMFNVIASATADPDLYKLDLTLSYEDPITNEQKEITTKAGVYVGGATDFDAAFSGTSNGEASFYISNIGSVSATSVTVKVPEQEGWKAKGSNSVIIGNLNEGDYTIASFSLQQVSTRQFQATAGDSGFSGERDAMQNATGQADSAAQMPSTEEDVTIMLDIIYTDSRGNRNTIRKEVPIDQSAFASTPLIQDGVSASARQMTMPGMRNNRQSQVQQAIAYGKWFGAGLIMLIILVVVYRKYKKAKSKDPDFKVKHLFRKKKSK